MVARIRDCRTTPACPSRVANNVRALRLPGPVSILQIQPSAGFSLGGTLGDARVAWKVPRSRPIVQCVKVQRRGDVLRGLRVELLEVSPRIKTDAGCPKRF
jgi:hypothetical protein